jgi:hypothetical protein
MSSPTNNWRSRRTEHSFSCGNRNGYHNMELGYIEAVSFLDGGNWSTEENHRPAASH